MLIVIYSPPGAGKTTFARHLAAKLAERDGKPYCLLYNEGQPRDGEKAIKFDTAKEPNVFLRESWDQIKDCGTLIVDSITGVHQAYDGPALRRCLEDEKLKNKSAAEKNAMTLNTIPFGMGPAVQTDLTKVFVDSLVKLSDKGLNVIVIAHPMTLSFINSDQVEVNSIHIGVGGQNARQATARMALQQHADAMVYIDATPEKEGKKDGKLSFRRVLTVGQHPVVTTKYRADVFGKDEFFVPDDHDINGKDNLLTAINNLFITPKKD